MEPKTKAEKILSNHANKNLEAGDFALCKVDFCLSQDGTSSIVMDRLYDMRINKIFNPDKFCMVIDHNAPAPNQKVAMVHSRMRKFAEDYDIKLFDAGCGICHQLMLERGYALPGELVIGADSHTCTYGALGAFASGVGSTDLSISLATGKNWFKVPKTIRIFLKGKLPKGVFSKDIILYIISDLGAGGANYNAIEFYGGPIKKMSMDARFTICNMAVEMGAKCCFLELDDKARKWIKARTKRKFKVINADKKARYLFTKVYDVSKIKPQVSRPHRVDSAVSVKRVLGTKIDEAFLGTCTNGRLEDLRISANMIKSRKINSRVRFIVAPASEEVFLKALKEGIVESFIKSGATVLNPGCGPCVGTHQGVPADKEAVISSANRNFKGRMGNPNAFIYLASPATVTASAIEGKIEDPRKYLS